MPKLWIAQIVAFTATTVVHIDKHYSRWTGKELDYHIRQDLKETGMSGKETQERSAKREN